MYPGYDDVTAEPVSAIVRDTRGDPDILNQIHDAQQRYRYVLMNILYVYSPMGVTSRLPEWLGADKFPPQTRMLTAGLPLLGSCPRAALAQPSSM